MDHIAAETVDELEARLRRIRYIIAGHSDSTDDELESVQNVGAAHNVSARLGALEHAFHRLSKQSPVVRDVAKLCAYTQGRHLTRIAS